jgi:hypothetical protein
LDEILRLRDALHAAEAERDRLREVLQQIEHYSNRGDFENDIARAALAALEEK